MIDEAQRGQPLSQDHTANEWQIQNSQKLCSLLPMQDSLPNWEEEEASRVMFLLQGTFLLRLSGLLHTQSLPPTTFPPSEVPPFLFLPRVPTQLPCSMFHVPPTRLCQSQPGLLSMLLLCTPCTRKPCRLCRLCIKLSNYPPPGIIPPIYCVSAYVL